VTESSKKREKFINSAVRRTRRAIEGIEKIGRLNNAHSYEWTDADIEKISKALDRAVDGLRKSFVPPHARGVFKL
jgi:hypothetical protein